ncbi:MAG: D-alanine--D-alanine ligase [Candidatus Shapirobacteria bacterium]|nr:D-alanine--D-alanine ligase [Candidatus Shapirobacteria bacterium]
MPKLRIVVLMGGNSSEHEVSLISGQEVLKNLDTKKYEVYPVILSKNKKLNIKDLGWIDEFKPDVVFIAMHGRGGEDGVVQGFLEFLGIKYTGCGVLASALGMDKISFKSLMKQNNINVPRDVVFKSLGNKWVVKPSDQGSSVGVSIVRDESKLNEALKKAFEFSDKAIVEEFIEGIELSCGVLGNENPMALPVIEICPKNEFFDYEAKYTDGKCEEIVPARISDDDTKMVQKIAVEVFKIVGGRGFARIDLILKNHVSYVLEINTIPGLTPNSLLPKEALVAGISYPELLERMIELALES